MDIFMMLWESEKSDVNTTQGALGRDMLLIRRLVSEYEWETKRHENKKQNPRLMDVKQIKMNVLLFTRRADPETRRWKLEWTAVWVRRPSVTG